MPAVVMIELCVSVHDADLWYRVQLLKVEFPLVPAL